MSGTITRGPGGTCYSGEDAIRLLQLITVKSAIKVEAVGMRVNRGRKVTPEWAKLLGKKRTDTAGICAALDERIAALREKIVVNVEAIRDPA